MDEQPINDPPAEANNSTNLRSPEDVLAFLDYQARLFGANAISALLILIFGWLIIKLFIWILSKILKYRKFNSSTVNFSLSVISAFMKFFLIMICINVLGIDSVNIAALLAASGLAIGLALSGFLQNFVAGGYLVAAKPIEVGHYVSVADNAEGTVIDIGIVNTVIRTPDYRQIIVPNSALANNNIINYDKEKIRRCDCELSVPMTEDINFARKVILRVCKRDPRILSTPEPMVRVLSLRTSETCIVLSVRAFVKKDLYWEVRWDLPELIKLDFERCNIKMQIPQQEIHMYEHDNEQPSFDTEFRQKMETMIIDELSQAPQKPDEGEMDWSIFGHDALRQLKGRLPRSHFWGWVWRKRAANNTELSANDEFYSADSGEAETDIEKGESEREKESEKDK